MKLFQSVGNPSNFGNLFFWKLWWCKFNDFNSSRMKISCRVKKMQTLIKSYESKHCKHRRSALTSIINKVKSAWNLMKSKQKSIRLKKLETHKTISMKTEHKCIGSYHFGHTLHQICTKPIQTRIKFTKAKQFFVTFHNFVGKLNSYQSNNIFQGEWLINIGKINNISIHYHSANDFFQGEANIYRLTCKRNEAGSISSTRKTNMHNKITKSQKIYYFL